MKIYADMYFYRIADVLGEDFPATRTAMGEEQFTEMVARYIAAHPPSHFSISQCGRHLADYVRLDPATARFPYAADLARLERTLLDSFHATDAPALDGDAMRRVAPADWPALRMRTHPATHLLDLHWRIADLRSAADEARALPAPARGECTILVWRSRNQARYREIDRAERAGLSIAVPGAAFSEICDAVAQVSDAPDTAAQVAMFLQCWLRDGVLIAD